MACSIPHCDHPVKARGLCNRHLIRWYRHGNPRGGGPNRGHVRKYLENVVLPYRGDECLLWPFAIGTHGYPVIGRGATVPRFVCTAIHGPPPLRAEALHRCDVRACVAPRHLHWGTRQQNEDDKLRVYAKRGRYSKRLDELH